MMRLAADLKDTLELMIVSMRLLKKMYFELGEVLVQVMELGVRTCADSVTDSLRVPSEEREIVVMLDPVRVYPRRRVKQTTEMRCAVPHPLGNVSPPRLWSPP